MKNNMTKTVFRVYWAWNDEKEERWLGRMAKEGWHLTAPRGVFYRFEKGASAEYVFRLDYQSPRKFDRREYLGLFKDAGWDFVGEFGNWYYFRTPSGPGPAPEIHTDLESRMAKYRRLLGFLVIICGAVWAPLLTTSWGEHRNPHFFWYFARGLQFTCSFLMTYAIIRIFIKIHQLKKDRQRRKIS
jgi:hypothetical protein